jgi:RNAse (barnase) inhibitor barstar
MCIKDMKLKKIYEIDGSKFSTLEEFYEVISGVLIPGANWGKNLDAFNDILRGGFGTPDEGFSIKWINSDISKERLGYAETVRQLEKRLKKCHASNREFVSKELAQAKEFKGSTVFDWIVEIIADHGNDGGEAEDGVELILK